MENNFLEKNLNQIAKYNKKLADKILAHDVLNKNFELSESKCGDPIISCEGMLLHDAVDPQQEALNIFKNAGNNEKSSIHVVFGLGLGYLFKRFSESSLAKVILFEPDLDILRVTLELVDLSEDFAKESIFLLNDKNDLQKTVEKIYVKNTEISLSFLSAYSKMYPDVLKDVADELGFIKGLMGSGYENLDNKSFIWAITSLLNFPITMKNNELESLRGKFAGKTAVIVSAGPSLNKNIDVLKQYQDNVVVFTVGAALKEATAHNIKTDFLVMVEHQDCMFQLAGIDTSDMNFILPSSAFKEFHTLNTKRKFNYYPNNDFVIKWLSNVIGFSLEDYQNKGTVSLCAVFSAMIMGFSQIIVIGQDLAYTNGNCYSENSPYRNMKAVKDEKTGKFKVIVDDLEEYFKRSDPNNKYTRAQKEEALDTRMKKLQKSLYSVKGYDGQMIPTESGYATFIRYFENIAGDSGDKFKFINATEGGAYLQGFDHISLKDALEKYAKNQIDVEPLIVDSLKDARNFYKEKRIDVLNMYNELINMMDETILTYKQAIEPIKSLEKLYKLKRFSDNSIQKHIKTILELFVLVEEKYITKNIVLYGLVYPTYSSMSIHISSVKNIGIDSIKEFIELSKKYFEGSYLMLSTHVGCVRLCKKQLEDDIEKGVDNE